MLAANLCNAEQDVVCLEAPAAHIQYGHLQVHPTQEVTLLPSQSSPSQTTIYSFVIIMRYLPPSVLFVVILCENLALALHFSAQLGININSADCVMAIIKAFSYTREPSLSELAQYRLFLHPSPNELQSMPRVGAYGTCAITIRISEPMVLGSINQLKDDAVHLVSECVGAHGTGGTHEAHRFKFAVMHHHIVSAARAAHQRQKTPGMPFLPPAEP